MQIPESLLQEIVQRILSVTSPERIILFGSAATDRMTPDSDIDLLVVYSGPKSRRDLQIEIQQLFLSRDCSLDVFVLSPDELERYRHVATSLAREVTEHGIHCYG